MVKTHTVIISMKKKLMRYRGLCRITYEELMAIGLARHSAYHLKQGESEITSMNFLGSVFGLLTLFSSFLCMVTLASCQQVPPEYEVFLKLPQDEQRAKMRALPIDKQIDYYLAGTHYVHPPLLGLGDVIAGEGKEAIPVLMKRLEEEKKDSNKMDLMLVFRSMHYFYYDLRDEKDVIELLKKVAANMETPEDKTRAEEIVKDIVENRPPDLQRFKDHHPEAFTKNPSP